MMIISKNTGVRCTDGYDLEFGEKITPACDWASSRCPEVYTIVRTEKSFILYDEDGERIFSSLGKSRPERAEPYGTD